MKIFIRCLFFCLFSSAVFAAPPQEYTDWVAALRVEMIENGVSGEFFDKVFSVDYYEERPVVLQKDKKMVEFAPTSFEYLNRIVTKERAEEAKEQYQKARQEFAKDDVVPLKYIIAFWSVETSFGRNKGRFNWIKCLVQLSYYGRRKKFFRKELIAAVKILQDNGISHEEAKSSWDGGVGNFQFMPTTYAHYAVDYNQNGKIDLWNEEGDSFASAINYLKAAGWQKGKIWGREVELPWNFDYRNTGKKHKQTLKTWIEQGVKANFPKNMMDDEGYIFLPEGRRGKAYLVFKNFDVIMRWNHSSNYALSVGILADYASSNAKWKKIETSVFPLTRDDIAKVQHFYNLVFHKKIHEDGRIGPQTREAVKQLQQKYELPQDGYPDWSLMKIVLNKQKAAKVPLPPRRKYRH